MNTYTPDFQSRPAIAMDGEGNLLTAWQSDGQDGSSGGIYAKFLLADSNVSSEFRVNTTTSGLQSQPDVALSRSYDGAIVWASSKAHEPSTGVLRVAVR
ncbi:MAG: hypothetical protein R2867_01525 [Caldilineaceae bacterium]